MHVCMHARACISRSYEHKSKRLRVRLYIHTHSRAYTQMQMCGCECSLCLSVEKRVIRVYVIRAVCVTVCNLLFQVSDVAEPLRALQGPTRARIILLSWHNVSTYQAYCDNVKTRILRGVCIHARAHSRAAGARETSSSESVGRNTRSVRRMRDARQILSTLFFIHFYGNALYI